ncbi:TPA: helix-turn-helix domain-containing protein [Enterococcus faecium]|nr:helix-turn-helix domain-containing protein [Enterococcus faecium]HAQ3723622.1 helix-turn-helix domain-containing protein [Enterococcus faecium]HAQ5616620.1 helix-turn-helix domain-containing protein [Enterococcus faecium]HAQ5913502.1 helix-turn-helix domain-containing protein [Enterococcus faecium]HAQ5975722.1 helix-turn-helix domain-containing protein [Enterococcus faecium]
MTDKTIKELADILGVSKDKVKYQLRKLPSNFTYKKGNIIYLKKEAVTTITKVLSGNEPGNLPSELPDSLPTDYLLKEIETKNNHIEEKDRQIEKLQLALETQQKLLDQQQQLTLQANQQIEKLQEQLQLTYTEESSENKSTTLSEETESIEKQSKTEKKWWQFWK